MPEKLQFPMIFSKCPACGCKETVARKMKDEEVAKGEIKGEVNAAMAQSVTPIMDQRELVAVRRVPILVTFYDVCLKCGCYYALRVEKTEGYIDATKPRQGPPPGLPFGFGRG